MPPSKNNSARSARPTPVRGDALPGAVQPTRPSSTTRLLPLGALAAGFGLLAAPVCAQTAAPAPAAAASAAESTLKPISVKARVETDQNSLRATTTTIGKRNQQLRDVPQSVTVVTEKLIEDRRLDTLKDALHQTAGISFQAAEGGEEDIRLRGFSLAASGDIYADSLRDPAFYERDTFSYDRIELLRGSASMLFGRGSTGGVVNQVSKLPFLDNATQIDVTAGTGDLLRFTGDFNLKLGDKAALRVNVMETSATNDGNRIDKQGLAPTLRWGIGSDDEFTLAGYYLHNNNGINYGLPWLRASASQTSANPSGLITGLDPHKYYQAQSDYNVSEADLATFSHDHRFAGGGELKSAVRWGHYDRDQRAGTIRFCTTVALGCPATLPGADTVNAATRLIENGPNNKIQNMHTTYAQSDYSNTFEAFGRAHDVLTGIDLAHEVFHAFMTPQQPALNKNVLPFTLGSDSNPNSVDETQRIKLPSSQFDAKALGLYFQDLVQVSTDWKLLGGLRWDYFKGSYQSYSIVPTAANGNAAIGAQTGDYHRTDALWSKRLGVLYQPNDQVSTYASYGTSFNTSGDTYQYDSQSSNTPPESSENAEIGAKIDLFEGRLSTRVAAFYSIKKNERNRDSDTGALQSLLSGKRHAAGLEFDLAGRLAPGWDVYGSYAWTPAARIDQAAPLVVAANGMTTGGTLGGEQQGQRPSLTPRHSGTIWTTWQVIPALRLGGGLNARSSETPNRNPAGIVAPHYVTGDLLAEFTFSEAVAFKLNVLNVTNKLYADSLYTAHYVPGPGRSVQLTMTARF